MRDDGAYDFIVVGAGTSGCLLANRLSERADRRVLLVEAGPAPKSLWVDMPAGVSRLIFPGPLNWGFQTEPEPQLAGRRIYAPRGRGLGGSSLINGMGFFRGQPQDYDAWATAGIDGWGWHDVLPLYRKFERRVGARAGAAPAWRGDAGELSISNGPVHASTLAFIEAGQAVGVPYNADFNGAQAEGIGPMQFNIHAGVRHSADKAFLAPIAGQRPNLAVLTGAQVTRIRFNGRSAEAVECVEHGALRELRCRGEVILCAGAFGTPQLLKASGVGPGAELQSHGIAVVHALDAVGENLQDHLYIHHTFASDRQTSMNHELRGARALWHGARYLLTHAGPLTNGASQACAFVRSGADVERADLQITYRPMSWSFLPNGSLEIGRRPEITVSACNVRPASRGRVLLASADPLAAPKIQANYLEAERDRELAVRAVRWVRKILNAAPFRHRLAAEVAPGPAAQSDEQILDYVRRTAQSMHHWAGSCRMGADAGSVVDPTLKVRGLHNLRIADASVLPAIVSANTNAACFMVAEKAATLIP
jgi:choline dehydrogenase